MSFSNSNFTGNFNFNYPLMADVDLSALEHKISKPHIYIKKRPSVDDKIIGEPFPEDKPLHFRLEFCNMLLNVQDLLFEEAEISIDHLWIRISHDQRSFECKVGISGDIPKMKSLRASYIAAQMNNSFWKEKKDKELDFVFTTSIISLYPNQINYDLLEDDSYFMIK